MDFTFIVADRDEQRGSVFRGEFRKLAEQKDFTYHLYSVSRPQAWNEMPEENLVFTSLAFVQLDFPDALEIGRRIYRANPFCRLIYYGEDGQRVIPLLSSRPVRYLDVSGGASEIVRCLDEEFEAVLRENGYFRYSDRYQSLCIPRSAILYFTSRDRATYYQTPKGERGPLRRTLEQISEMVYSGDFLRCHKSFLVNRGAIGALDKTARELILLNGERIPVSRGYWTGVLEQFM